MKDIIFNLIKMFVFVLKNKQPESNKHAKSDILSIEDIITSSNKYPERALSEELNDTVKLNIKNLLKKLNPLLEELNLKNVKVSSGFRPSSVNNAIKNAAKNSAHKTGEACDLLDPDGKIDKLITKELLNKYDLYREDSDFTKGWCHIQIRPTKSGKRIFKP